VNTICVHACVLLTCVCVCMYVCTYRKNGALCFRKVSSDLAMENIYTARGHVLPNLTARGLLTVGISGQQMTQEGVLSLVVVLGSSVSLVGLVFAFITYR
jgi:hypothetical protein